MMCTDILKLNVAGAGLNQDDGEVSVRNRGVILWFEHKNSSNWSYIDQAGIEADLRVWQLGLIANESV